MKILHMISSGGIYGAESVILNLMHSLIGGPHQFALGVFLNAGQPNLQLHTRAAAEGLETHIIACNGQFDIAALTRIRDLVKTSGADVVHAHGYKADVYLYAALGGATVPCISTCHTWYDNDLAVRIYGALDRLVLRGFTKVVAVSHEVRERLLQSGVPTDRIALIRNGIDVQSFHCPMRLSDRPLRVGLVGRLAREKSVDHFIRAAAQVLARLSKVSFVVAGEGPAREALQSLIHELGLDRSMSLIGRQEDMCAFYKSVDLIVSSSQQEGFPIAILEAMASGLPVVATSAGDVPCIVVQGETGIMVNPGDVGGLTQAMCYLLENPIARVSFGVAARERVAREFSVERMSTEYLALYEQALLS
jgi:glycosyltransferase involved in cell wall biosynthesis